MVDLGDIAGAIGSLIGGDDDDIDGEELVGKLVQRLDPAGLQVLHDVLKEMRD